MIKNHPFQQAIPRDCPTWSEAKRSEPELDAMRWIMRVLEMNPPPAIVISTRVDAPRETPKRVNVQKDVLRRADAPKKVTKRVDALREAPKRSEAQREADKPAEAEEHEEGHLNDDLKKKGYAFLRFVGKYFGRGAE